MNDNIELNQPLTETTTMKTDKAIPTDENRLICSFWARVNALLLDIAFLWILGIIISTLFFNQFVQIGQWDRLIGFL